MSSRNELIRSGREDFDDFLSWLEDHNWCKVTPCIICQNFRPSSRLYGRCSRTDEIKYNDDYCSEAKEDVNELQ